MLETPCPYLIILSVVVLTVAGEAVASLGQNTPQVGREVTPSQVHTSDGVREGVA